MSIYRRYLIRSVFFIVVLSSLIYIYGNRYYFRILPITPSALAWLDHTFPGAVSSTLSINSQKELPHFDLTEETGVNAALDYVRNFSPLAATTRASIKAGAARSGRMTHSNITTVDSWLNRLKLNSGYCTDFTLLLTMMANQQGLPVREWNLWRSNGWSGGDAHTMSEVFNPKTGRWRLLDGQHAIKLNMMDGQPAAMTDILREYYPNNMGNLKYSIRPSFLIIAPWLVKGSRDAIEAGIKSPVLNFKPVSWFASTPKSELVIGLAILTGASSHDRRIYTTKLLFIFVGLFAILVLIFEASSLKKRNRTSNI
jgi:hypothetical protein